MDDNSLRFILLHEEGHAHWFQWSSIIMLLIALIIFPLTLYFVILQINFLLILLFCAIIIILLMRLFNIFLQKDEYNSDIFSANILIQHYNYEKISTIAQIALNSAHTILIKKNLSQNIYYNLEQFIKVHPTDTDRVKNIKLYEEKQLKKSR